MVGLAVLLAFIPPLILHEPLMTWIYRAFDSIGYFLPLRAGFIGAFGLLCRTGCIIGPGNSG